MANREAADKLIAEIVEQNVVDAAATSDKLIQYEQDRAIKIAKGLTKLYDALCETQVIDRKLLDIQHSLTVEAGVNLAESLLQETGDL